MGYCREPDLGPITTAAFVQNAQKKEIRVCWTRQWAAHAATTNHRSDFRAANSIPPSTKPSHRLRSLRPKLLARVLQCRTGHAFIGSYYDYFNIPEPTQCPCGAFQTRNHILLNCPRFDDFRPILEDNKGRIDLEDLLGTSKGCKRLTRFIKITRAFDKAAIT